MILLPRRTLAASLAAALLVPAPAYAQSQLTQQEAQAYFERFQRQATEIVRSGDFSRLTEWIERNFADDAQFQLSMNLIHDEERKGQVALTVDKDDMLRMGGLLAGVFQQQRMEDYSLEIELREVVPHGPDAATARTSWTESFTVRAPQGEGAAEAEPLGVEGMAECVQLLQRDGDHLIMGLMTCTGEVHI